eukprot:8243788-Pyramimonas_sp.AAC.1
MIVPRITGFRAISSGNHWTSTLFCPGEVRGAADSANGCHLQSTSTDKYDAADLHIPLKGPAST